MFLILFFFSLFIQLLYSQCTASAPYLLVSNNTCFAECPWTAQQHYYASPFDNTCVTVCPSTWYGFDGNKTCTQTCPSSPNMTFYDTINSKCVTVCPANYFSYIGSAANNQSCVSPCPSGTFAQQTKRQCVATCPSNTYYKNDSNPYCVIRCPDNYYASPIDRNCKVGGSCPTTPVRYFADDTTNMCVINCPNNTFADITTGRCLLYCSSGYFADKTTWRCVQTCPTDYYRSVVTRSCLLKCTEGYFIDRKTLNCTQTCSAGTFGDFATGYCQIQCTPPTFSDSAVGRCVNVCSLGTYADNFTQSCVTELNCYSNWVGDPTNRRCVQPSKCPSSPYHYANLVAKICTPKCPAPLWGDKSSKTCVSVCPWNPGTYVSWKNPDTQECVVQCPQFPILYADNSTQTCVSQCPGQGGSLAYDTFADDISQSCVKVCPTGFKSKLAGYICVSQCPTLPTLLYFYPVNSSCISQCPSGYYGDSSKQKCVQKCPTTPDYYGLDSNTSCVEKCPIGKYADASTRKCVTWCPQTTLQYADDSTNKCVDICSSIPDYFGSEDINSNRICVATCDVGLFADPVTRTCVAACNITLGYYGQLLTPVRRCLIDCPVGKYADNVTKTCVSKCPSIPVIYYGNPSSKRCQLTCAQFLYGNSVTNVCGQPSNCQTGFFADDLTNKCVKTCPVTQSTFGQPTSRRCLKYCPEGLFADNTTRKCQVTCNATAKLYKDPSTNKCVFTCPSLPNLYNDPATMRCQQRCTNNWYAYDGLRKCVQICPSSPPLFGNVDTRRCVDTCPRQRYKYVDNAQRSCLSYCPPITLGSVIDLYADNTTWSCVQVCPKASNLYSFKHPDIATVRLCVSTCPMVNSTIYYFADNITQGCVLTCPLKNLTWGDTFTLKCEKTCTRNQYRDNGTVRCTYQCSSPYYADNTTWNCVKQCPNGTFAFSLGTNRTCLRQCPRGTYADNKTKFCRSLCDHDPALWSDNTTWECVKVCPTVPDLYADPNTDKCQFGCSNGLFADKVKRKCVPALQCSPGTIGDPRTYRCISRCPIQVPSFWETSSNTCVPQCQPGFYADNSTMKCVPQCPSYPDFYAYNHSTIGPICVLYCPPTFYKHSINRTCLTACPAPDYFKDSTTMKCVQNCPDHWFAQIIGQVCVSNCSVNSKYGLNNVCYPSCTGQYNADPTTYLCVKSCPFTYFSEANVCTPTCAVGYADPITKICQPTLCSPGYYAQIETHLCVQDCQPQYKLDANQTCLPSCPKTSDHATNLYMDNNSYMCVNKCLPGWYADNITSYCQIQCSSTLFSDNSTGRCVSQCPATPDYYGYQRVCYFPCPAVGLYAQNTSRLCLNVCPAGSFADDYNQRCMDVCTLKQYSHSYVNLGITYNVCVQKCPNGTYATDTNKSCVPVCPDGTYGDNTTNKCLRKCPTGSFADDFLHLCVLQCQVARQQFKDWSTNRCVKICPSTPSLYAQNSSRSCVSYCGTSWYGLNTTRICTQSCPSPFYADPSTGFCQYKCFVGANRFADDVSRSCVLTCPNYTDPITLQLVITYADNSTKKCVTQCPFFPSLYGYNNTNQCVQDCPALTFGDNDTRLCVDKCFWGITVNGARKYTYADPTTRFCVKQCPKTYFADNFTITCTQYCTQGTFADNSTWRCVFMCPTNPVSYARISTRQCVYQCDTGFFGDQLTRQCLDYCPTQPYMYYKDYQHLRCVKTCVSETTPYFAEDLSQSCVTSCTLGYYKSLSKRQCVKCPSSCLTCLAQLNCTSCVKGLYLYEGECIQSCPTFPIRNFANDLSSACTPICPLPYFGFAGTGKCQLNCPEKYYNDITDNTCKDCKIGCRTCTNSQVCLSCLSGYIFVPSLFTCSKVCSQVNIYYVQGKCSSTCVDGTFLQADLVSCQKCSTTCATCSGTGSNCTKCNNKFWYNYNCVDQCPKDFFADKDNTCRDCQSNLDACKVEPLRYTIQIFTRDYKLFAYVKFNRAINLTVSQLYKIIVIKTSKGPVKLSAYTISNYNSTAYLISFKDTSSFNQMPLNINMNENTIDQSKQDQQQQISKDDASISSQPKIVQKQKQIEFINLNLVSLNELDLIIGFIPGSIKDQFGNPLVDTTETTPIPQLSVIPQATQKQATQMKSSVNKGGIIIMVVVIIMMIKCSYPLIVLLDFIQLIYMHLYIEIRPLPYMWMTIISTLEQVNFTFLPKLYNEDNLNSSQNKFTLFKTDITCLGNMHPLLLLGAIYTGIYVLFWAISKCRIRIFRCIRKPCRKLFKNRMRFMFFNEIFYYTLVYCLYFAILQWPMNRSHNSTIGNLAMTIVIVASYVAWMIFLMYKSSYYRNNLDRMPKRYKFLVLQPTKFPLDMSIRYFLKFLFCFCLLISQPNVQLILLMILNFIYFLYNLVYKPFKDWKTNWINMFVSLGFIGYQIALFVYNLGSKSTQQQYEWSNKLFAVIGAIGAVIIIWIILRLLLWIKQDICGVKSVKQEDIYQNNMSKEHSSINKDKQIDQMQSNKDDNVFSFFNWNKLKSTGQKSQKPIKSNYNKVLDISRNGSVLDIDQKTEKNMLPQLHFNDNDKDDESEDEQEINQDAIINQFAYHMVPKKNAAILQKEKQVMARKQIKEDNKNSTTNLKKQKKSKIAVPMVIAIDQDQLIDKNLELVMPNLSQPTNKTNKFLKTSQNISKPLQQSQPNQLQVIYGKQQKMKRQQSSRLMISQKSKSNVIWNDFDSLNSQNGDQLNLNTKK